MLTGSMLSSQNGIGAHLSRATITDKDKLECWRGLRSFGHDANVLIVCRFVCEKVSMRSVCLS